MTPKTIYFTSDPTVRGAVAVYVTSNPNAPDAVPVYEVRTPHGADLIAYQVESQSSANMTVYLSPSSV